MHSRTIGQTTFQFHDDFSGDVKITDHLTGQTVEIPSAALMKFISENAPEDTSDTYFVVSENKPSVCGEVIGADFCPRCGWAIDNSISCDLKNR